MGSEMSSRGEMLFNKAVTTNRAVPLGKRVSSSKTSNQPKINQLFSGGNNAQKAFAVRKDVSKSSSKPNGSSRSDKQRYKEAEKAYADLHTKFNDEKEHSQDLAKEMAQLRAFKAETAGLAIKRLREQIEDLERLLRIEKLQTLGYGLLLKHVERDVRQWACKYSLPVEELPNFSLWDEVPETGFKPSIRKSDFSILSHRGKDGSKRKRGVGDEDDEITVAKRKNVMGWQRAQEDEDPDDESDYEFESEMAMLARIKRETKALVSN